MSSKKHMYFYEVRNAEYTSEIAAARETNAILFFEPVFSSKWETGFFKRHVIWMDAFNNIKSEIFKGKSNGKFAQAESCGKRYRDRSK